MKQLSEKQFLIHTAVAISLGWTSIEKEWFNWDGPEFQYLHGIPGNNECQSRRIFETVPNYTEDLNAMQEVWEDLSMPEKADFAVELNRLMGMEFNICGWIHLIGATAAQRAEAYLKMLGLWTKEMN